MSEQHDEIKEVLTILHSLDDRFRNFELEHEKRFTQLAADHEHLKELVQDKNRVIDKRVDKHGEEIDDLKLEQESQASAFRIITWAGGAVTAVIGAVIAGIILKLMEALK